MNDLVLVLLRIVRVLKNVLIFARILLFILEHPIEWTCDISYSVMSAGCRCCCIEAGRKIPTRLQCAEWNGEFFSNTEEIFVGIYI